MTFLASFLASMLYVAAKALQQLNVVHGLRAWVMPLSLVMGVLEVGIVLLVVKADTLLLGLVNGLGAGFGALLAMRFHQRVVRKET